MSVIVATDWHYVISPQTAQVIYSQPLTPERMIDLALSVKPGAFREEDPDHDKADRAFQSVRLLAYERDQGVCQGCGLQTQAQSGRTGYFEIHHRDNDHHHNDLENLVTVCPFCHGVFHFGLVHVQGRGYFVPARGLTQRAVHRLLFLLWAESFLADPACLQAASALRDWIRQGTELMAQDPYRAWADGAAVANALREALAQSDLARAQRLQAGLTQLVLIPNLEAPAYRNALRHWSQVLAARWTPGRVTRYLVEAA